MKSKRQSYLFAGLTILFWGTAASAFKFTLYHFSFIQLLAWASLFSTILLFSIIVFGKKLSLLKKTTSAEIAPSLYLGLLNPFAYYFVLLKAYELLPAQVAQPLNFIWPLMLVLLSVPILGEKITAKGIVALVISFMGVILISSQGNIAAFKIESPLGVGLALISSIFWALYWILNLKRPIDPVIRLFYNFLFATIFSFGAGIFFTNFWDINIRGILGSLYVGSFEMGITFVLWLKALSIAESKAKLSNIIYLVPFVSLLFIHFFVGEKMPGESIAAIDGLGRAWPGQIKHYS